MIEEPESLHSFHITKEVISPTLLGCVAIFFWSTLPLLSCFLRTIPTFEILAIVFSIGCLLALSKIQIKKEWLKIKYHPAIFLMGGIAIFGNDALFITAIKFAPSEQVTLLFYTWPILVTLIAYFSTGKRFTINYLIACGLGFYGTDIVLTNGFSSGLNLNYFYGYCLALGSALVWSVYTLVSSYFKELPHELVGLYLGIAAICAVTLHFYFESNVVPTLNQLLILIIMGLTTEGLAYILWDCGIKKGNNNFLYLISYCNPLIGIGLLILFKQTAFNTIYLIACLLIIFGNVLSRFTDQ